MTPFSRLVKGALIGALLLVSLQTKAANFYWLASHYDNNWFDGRNWSHTPGGAAIGNSCACAGTEYPGTNDDVFIDASIGGQISFGGLSIQMKSLTYSGAPTATTELYGYGAMSVFGSLVFVSNMKVNISYLNLYGSGGSDVITTAGNDMKDCATYIGSGNYSLTGDYTASGNYGALGIGGTFTTNNYTILANDVTASNSSAIVFNMGSSTIQAVNFNMNYSPGSQTLTINPGTSSVNFVNNFIGSNKTYYSVTKIGTSGSGTNVIGGGNTFTNLTINAGVSCLFSTGVSQTITGNLTVVGTSVNRITLGPYGSGSFTLIAPNGSAMAYVDITNGIASNAGSNNEFTTTNSTKTNCHGWDRTAPVITFANVNKNYGAASFSMTATSTSVGLFTYSITSGNSFATINSTNGTVAISGAGSVTVKASQAGDQDYLPGSTTATLTIAKIPLTVTANNKSRLYGAANPIFDFSYSGFANSETSSVLTSLPTASTSATSASGVNTYAIVPSGGSAANYTLSYVNGTLSITPASITVTVNNATRTYGASDPTFTYSYSGFVNGDNASVFQTQFSTPTTTATANSSVGTYAINANGGNVGPNYSVSIGGYTVYAGTLTISKAPLTVTANNKSRVYGAANPAFDFNYSGFVNSENSSALSTSPTASTTATPASAVNTYAIVPSGAAATNYSFNYVNGALSITKAPLTITANNKLKVYGAALPTFDFSYSGFVNGENASALSSLPTASTSATTASVVATYSIVPSGGSAANYSLSYVNGTLAITPAPISVTVNDATRVYGAANPTFTYSYSGFVNGDDASAFSIPFTSPTTTATTSSTTGTYAINANGGNVGPNYSVSIGGYTVYAGTLTISKAPLTVTANNKSRVYGAANPTFDFNYSGFVNGETSSALSSLPTASTSATTASGVNTYSIVPSGAAAANYSFNYVNGTLSITKAPLTITANNKSKVYGATNPIFDFSYSGFVNGDNSSALSTSPTASTSATAASGVNTYAIIPSGGSAANYSLAYANGTLTVTPASITVIVNNATRTYGAADPTFSYSYTGFVNGDNASAFQIPFSAPTTTATINSPTGTYAINANGGNVGPNYSVNIGGYTVLSGTLTITKAPVTVTANNKTKIYGAANPAFDFTYSGFVNGENSSALSSLPTASTSATTASGVNIYSIVPSGAAASNYSFNYVNGTLSVTQAPLTVIANDASRTYGNQNPVFTFSYSGFVNGDDSSVINVQPTATTTATAQSNTGTYPITPSGGAADNYSLSVFQPGTLTITKANQTITFAPLTSLPSSTGTVNLTATSSSGLPISYSSSNLSVATINGNTMTIIGTGTSDITASQPGDGNYNAATPVIQTQLVKLGQTITFTALPAKQISDAPFNLSATSSSGLTVTFTSSDPSVATVAGNTVTIVAAGSVVITAHQSGDATYAAANDVNQTLVINKLSQTITFAALDNHLLHDQPFTLSATSSSSLAVTYSSSNSSVATVAGNTVTILGVGTTNITASQSGNNSYAAATDVVQGLTIKLITAIEPSATAFQEVYPNPTTGVINFTLQSESDAGNVKLFDLRGREIVIEKPITTGQLHFAIDISNLTPGMYLLHNGASQAVKIIKN